ncbi:MAG: DNA repair protein RecO [Pyrinomonadaceae bacterium]
MPLFETESMVLKTYNLGDADKIVVLLTHDHGIIRGVAKGAKRLKSRFGSGLEPFSVVTASYFQKDSQELVSIQKIDIVRSNFTAASAPDFLQKFSYLSDILIMFLPPHDPNPTMYRMVRACIETAAVRPDAIQALGLYFEIWLLRLSGYLPDWGSCDECARAFEEGEGAGVRSNFHLICLNCHRSSRGMLDGASRRLAASAMSLSPGDFAEAAEAATESVPALSRILRQLISHSAGREVAGETSLAVGTGN